LHYTTATKLGTFCEYSYENQLLIKQFRTLKRTSNWIISTWTTCLTHFSSIHTSFRLTYYYGSVP